MNHYAKRVLSPNKSQQPVIALPQDPDWKTDKGERTINRAMKSGKLRSIVLENMTHDELVEYEMRKLSKDELTAIAKGDMKPMEKVKEAIPEVFRMQYPKDSKLISGMLNLRKQKASNNMPVGIQQACMVLAAAFTKAIPYYDRYELYEKSVPLTKDDVAKAYGKEKWEEILPSMRNKLERCMKAADKKWDEDIEALGAFFNQQAKHMDTWTDDEYDTVGQIEEVVLDLILDPTEVETYITKSMSPDPNYFFTTRDLARYLIVTSKGQVNLFPDELKGWLKENNYLAGRNAKGVQGWYAIITQNV